MYGSDPGLKSEGRHAPVLLDACVDALVSIDVPSGRVFVDGTFGRGGHAREILSRIAPLDRLVVIDRDPEATAVAVELAKNDSRIIVVQGTWETAIGKLQSLGVNTWHGVLLDLGISSPQLDDAARGFSFQVDGPLDMRMDPHVGTSAADWLNSADEKDISRVLFEYGEEREARRIAKTICAHRPLHRTSDLVEAVRQAVPVRAGRKHEATRTFQAIRISVNDELGLLQRSLPRFFSGLAASGRLVVISFHSLEDRIVKQTFRTLASPPGLPRHLPIRAEQLRPPARLLGKSIAPEPREILSNPRSRSARLRILERLS